MKQKQIQIHQEREMLLKTAKQSKFKQIEIGLLLMAWNLDNLEDLSPKDIYQKPKTSPEMKEKTETIPKCAFCGENEGTESITDGETLREVDVCKECNNQVNQVRGA